MCGLYVNFKAFLNCWYFLTHWTLTIPMASVKPMRWTVHELCEPHRDRQRFLELEDFERKVFWSTPDMTYPLLRLEFVSCVSDIKNRLVGPVRAEANLGLMMLPLSSLPLSLSRSLALSLSNLITTRPQGMGPAGVVCQGTMPTSGQMVLRFYNFKPISRRYYYMISWCSAPHGKPRWRRIDPKSGKERLNVNSASPISHTDSNGE